MFCQCCKLPRSKICSQCKVEKSVDSFASGRKQCKDCRKQYNAKKYLQRKDTKKDSSDEQPKIQIEIQI